MHRTLFRISGVVLVVVVVFSGFERAESSHSKRVKCPIGKYYNDGCTECKCDLETGTTTCDKSRCPDHPRACPHGEVFKDRSGNPCKCYEETGAVFCSILAFRKKGILQNPAKFSHRASSGLEGVEDNNNEILIDIEAIEDSSSQMDQIAEESMPKISLLSDKTNNENFARAFYASSEENESKMPPMKMLEYSGRRWKMRPERIAFSNYKEQIDKVLETLREKRNTEEEALFVELPQL